MKLLLQQSNILDIPADVLVCSANVMLNLTGGVGADIIARYGTVMQAELHAMLEDRTPKCAKPGEVFVCHTPGLPYKAVLHAVAVDPFYHSSQDVITRTVRKALEIAAECGAKTVALTALASGFGDLTLDDFAEGVRPLLSEDFGAVETLIVPQIEDYRFRELVEAFPEGRV
jgi:O-acetyl-ADP-ribose deacetylase (regulator of RNase III)